MKPVCGLVRVSDEVGGQLDSEEVSAVADVLPGGGGEGIWAAMYLTYLHL